MRHLVFLLEELSAKAMLESLLPRILPPDSHYRMFTFEGKQDLEKNLARKLRSYLVPDARFIVMRDQDSGDCRVIKARLVELCSAAGKDAALVRIACKELESWYLADLAAVSQAFEKPFLIKERNSARYRHPDAIDTPSRELKRLLPEYQKIEGSRRIGRFLDPDNKTSTSFAHFVSAVRTAIA